jgi:hypothetical protein
LRCFLTSRSRATCAKNVIQNFRCGEEIPTIIDEASKIVPAIWDCTVLGSLQERGKIKNKNGKL